MRCPTMASSISRMYCSCPTESGVTVRGKTTTLNRGRIASSGGMSGSSRACSERDEIDCKSLSPTDPPTCRRYHHGRSVADHWQLDDQKPVVVAGSDPLGINRPGKKHLTLEGAVVYLHLVIALQTIIPPLRPVAADPQAASVQGDGEITIQHPRKLDPDQNRRISLADIGRGLPG